MNAMIKKSFKTSEIEISSNGKNTTSSEIESSANDVETDLGNVPNVYRFVESRMSLSRLRDSC
jgi:hypothetical protein